MARVPDATRETFPDELTYVWDAVADGREPPNIFKALGNNPALLRAYLRLGNGLWQHCGLDLQMRELAILKAAMNKQSRYEWHQHVRIGRDAGLSDARIKALHNWRESAEFSAKEKTLLRYIDELGGETIPTREAYDAMIEEWGLPTTVGVTMLIPFYDMTAQFLAAMEVEPEESFVGWTLEGE